MELMPESSVVVKEMVLVSQSRKNSAPSFSMAVVPCPPFTVVTHAMSPLSSGAIAMMEWFGMSCSCVSRVLSSVSRS